ncbi:hypothetical protein [Companilactobacillus kimchiensis]|nr:hypothetical protein [Companilactobacillus kimchiensis]
MRKIFYSMDFAALIGFGGLQMAVNVAQSNCSNQKAEQRNEMRSNMKSHMQNMSQCQGMRKGRMMQYRNDNMASVDTTDNSKITMPMYGPGYWMKFQNKQMMQNDFMTTCIRMNSDNFTNN